MSGIITPGGLNPITSLTDNAVIEVNESGAAVNNKITKSNLKETLGINQNATDISSLESIVDPSTRSILLTPGRKAFQEKTSDTLSNSGSWVTVAETEAISAAGGSGVISVWTNENGESLSFRFNIRATTDANQTFANNTLEIISKSTFRFTGVNETITGVRLAKGGTGSSGLKLQIRLDQTAQIYVQLTGHHMRSPSSKGVFLVTPYLDNTPTLPDGVTPATFIEAGAELSLSLGTTGRRFLPHAKVAYSSNDKLRVALTWPEIPKQGVSVVITPSGTSIQFLDGQGNNTTLGSHAISNFFIDGRTVVFDIDQIGVGSGLNVGPISMLMNGGGGKITIT